MFGATYVGPLRIGAEVPPAPALEWLTLRVEKNGLVGSLRIELTEEQQELIEPSLRRVALGTIEVHMQTQAD
jgi:hypothetical protein